MVLAQLMAFGRVSQCREEGRERKRLKEARKLAIGTPQLINGEAKHAMGGRDPPNGYGRHVNGAGLRKLSAIREESYFDQNL